MTDLHEARPIVGGGAAPAGRPTLASLHGPAGLTPAARRYALRELARRAGVSEAFFRSWRVTVDEEETTVCIDGDRAKWIRFLHAPPRFWKQDGLEAFHTVRAAWMATPPERLRGLIPELIVPFCPERHPKLRPLFAPVDVHSVDCSQDLLASVLLTLARFEEYICLDRDPYGCFPPSRSLAVRDQFLERPVVDEWGLALEQALLYLLPGWQPCERRLRVKLSHDVDWVGPGHHPLSAFFFAAHMVRHHGTATAKRELFRWLGGRDSMCIKLVSEIAGLSLERGLDSAVYWMAAPPSRRDPGYDPRRRPVSGMIAWLRDQGVEMGVHPGYHTFGSPARLRQEVELLRQVLGESRLGGRQHYLRWSPQSWRHWEMCGLAYDSTVGYADRIGFRAGTCIPYRPWLLDLDREANLIEIPLLVMNGTLTHYMRLTPEEGLAGVAEIVARCRAVGGVFTLLWHNDALIDPAVAALYKELLDLLGESDRYDWRDPAGAG